MTHLAECGFCGHTFYARSEPGTRCPACHRLVHVGEDDGEESDGDWGVILFTVLLIVAFFVLYFGGDLVAELRPHYQIFK